MIAGGKNAGVNVLVVVRSAGNSAQFAAGHQDDPAADLLDGFHLEQVGGHDVINRSRLAGLQMVRSRTVDYQRIRKLTPRSADEFTRTTPIEAHTPLGGVHGLRDSEAQVRKVPPERERCLPVDDSRT